jgi:hypothetical protein
MSFNYPHARASDPATSHEAVPINITEQAFLILLAYSRSRPLLDHDAYRMAGFGPNARDGQRCSDLRRAGLIERTGKRALTPSGKPGHLCRITVAGHNYLKNANLPDVLA